MFRLINEQVMSQLIFNKVYVFRLELLNSRESSYKYEWCALELRAS